MSEDYTLKPEDAGKILEVDGNDINDETNVIIPNNSNVPIEIGTEVRVYRANEKQVKIEAESGVNLESFTETITEKNGFPTFWIPKYSEAQIRKRALNGWTLDLDGINVVPVIFAEGGDEVFTIEQNGQLYRVHTFTTVGESEFDVTIGSGEVEYLIVAGGGGTTEFCGGGGAGGVLNEKYLINNVSSYQVVIGEGGLGITDGLGNSPTQDGGVSSIFGFTAIGGGGGISSNVSELGRQGGSGGGIGPRTSVGGSGTAGQGNDGGDGHSATGNSGGSGGGGGATQTGGNGGFRSGGNGGNGLFIDWANVAGLGENGWFGGGGAGFGDAREGASTAGTPGLGGGGSPATGESENQSATAGMENTGGGAGAAGPSGSIGRNGGSGIVIVRYRIG